MKYFIVLTSF